MLLPILLLIIACCINENFNIEVKRKNAFEPRLFANCFEDIGCIDTTTKWYDEKYRPKNLEPLDRHTIRTEFLLMKQPKNNSSDLVYDIMTLKRETVDVAGFRKGCCSIFIFHDFTSNGYTGWIKHLVVAFTHKTDCNIISVDWQAGAEPPFDQAIANARVVALETKAFINLLRGCFNQLPENLHLIGHGIGAHIAGYVGKYVSGLQRITGLDPTGPSFDHMPKEVRLDVTDAKYVEVLHTDAYHHRSQGTRETHGHANFLINNANHQPGCNDSHHMPLFTELHRDTLQEGNILPACSHKRSFKYYIESLENDDCHFIGIRCESYKAYLSGQCNNCRSPKSGVCATFGLQPPSVTTSNNTYYMLTNGKKPFCMVLYSVNITIDKGASQRIVEGYFEFILVDHDDKVINASSNINGELTRKFESGKTYGFLFYGIPPRINKIKEAKVKWTYKSKKICILCEKAILIKDIGIKRVTMKTDNSSHMNWICPAKRGSDIKSGDYVEFLPCESLYGPSYGKTHKQMTFRDFMLSTSTTKFDFVCNTSNAIEATTTSIKTTTPSMSSHQRSVAKVDHAHHPETVNSELPPAAHDKELQVFRDCFGDNRGELTTTTEECTIDKKSVTYDTKLFTNVIRAFTSPKLNIQPYSTLTSGIKFTKNYKRQQTT